MNSGTLTKSEFATRLGVSAPRVSQLVNEKKIHGPALVGSGRKARINVAIALEQLDKNLDISQRTGMNGKAKLDARPRPSKPAPAQSSDESSEQQPLEEKIKLERFQQLALANDKAREEAAARSGRYVRAEDARQEMGRIAGRSVAAFDGALGEFATAIAAKSNLSPREALHILRRAFHEVRARNAQRERQAAEALPELIDDGTAEAPQ
jgi:hypothetical protein